MSVQQMSGLGRIPRPVEGGRMVLLPKPGWSLDSPPAFRPVCLLDEAGKLLERMVTARHESHLSRRAPGLHDAQFGFRRGPSTTDDVARVRSLVERAERRGFVTLAVSLDAFNSIPWDRISRALEFHRVPAYLSVWSGRSSGTAVSSTPEGAVG
jgi:hypothetical protein